MDQHFYIRTDIYPVEHGTVNGWAELASATFSLNEYEAAVQWCVAQGGDQALLRATGSAEDSERCTILCVWTSNDPDVPYYAACPQAEVERILKRIG